MKPVGFSDKLVTGHKNKRNHVSNNNNLKSDNNEGNATELSDTYCQQGKNLTGINVRSRVQNFPA